MLDGWIPFRHGSIEMSHS